MLERVEALPGAEAATFATAFPHNEQFSFTSFTAEGNPAKPGEQRLANYHSISPGFFRTLRIPLEQGRYFEPQDTLGSARVAIVSGVLARRYYAGSPIGKRIRIGDEANPGPPWMTIVGVAADAHMSATDREVRPAIYIPLRQEPMRSMGLAVRTADPTRLTAAVLGAVREVDRDQPVYEVKTMEQLIDDDTTGLRFLAVLMSSFGALALALAAIGVYAVMSYVTERTHEIGVRVALGARPRDVFGAVLLRGLGVTAAGIVLGTAAALALARLLANMIYGVSTTDVATFTGVAAVLSLAALAASYLPARRALRVDPIAALRWE